jgi:cytochrome d ubiquinol oxidase subunit II
MVSLLIYIVLASIEFGSSIFALFPRLLDENHVEHIAPKNTVSKYMNPVYEATTVFLIFTFISINAFFPAATIVWATALLPLVFTFLIIFGVRIFCILLTYYADIQSKIISALYFVTSMLVPATLGLILLYFLTGNWHIYLFTWIYFWLALAMISMSLALASSFFRWYQHNTSFKLNQLVRASSTLMFLSGTMFWLTLNNRITYFARYPYLTVVIASLLILCMVLAVIAEMCKKPLYTFFAVAGFVKILFWGVFIEHLPYLIYPTVTIYGAVTNPASFRLLILSLCIGAVIVIPAMFLLYNLFVVER